MMRVYEQDFKDGKLQQTRVNLLGGRGIEAVVAIEHTRGNQAVLRWLLYDGHGNLVRTMAPDDYTLSAWQFRGVWGEVQGTLGAGRGYCANLGHPEDETGLVYMRARYYEPATGRFISEDPARDGVNWYLYADGNPVGKVDAEGEVSTRDVLEWIQIILASYIGIKLIDKFLDKIIGYLIKQPLLSLGNYLNKLGKRMITEGTYLLEEAQLLSTAAGVTEGFLKEWYAAAAANAGRLGARKIAMGMALQAIGRFLIGIAEE